MNVERILALADVIEAQTHTRIVDKSGFNMLKYQHKCGTPACIAGFAQHVAGKKDEGAIYLDAMDFLDIDSSIGFPLFHPDTVKNWRKITPAHAATTLRNLAKTGVVDWSHVNEVQS